MPVTPLTTECRAVAARMLVFPNCEGNIQYLRKLIYEDSKTLTSLIGVAEGLTGPAIGAPIIQNLYKATATCGSCGECSGNTNMWPVVTAGAAAVIIAVDAVEGHAVEDEAEAAQQPNEKAPPVRAGL